MNLRSVQELTAHSLVDSKCEVGDTCSHGTLGNL